MTESSVSVGMTVQRPLTIPGWTVTSRNLSDGAIRLYLAYASLVDVTGHCAPRVETLCSMLHISPDTAYRRRHELERAGLIQVNKGREAAS